MDKAQKHKNSIRRFMECINTNDKALAEELIDSRAEFLSLTSPENSTGARAISQLWNSCEKVSRTFIGRLRTWPLRMTK